MLTVELQTEKSMQIEHIEYNLISLYFFTFTLDNNRYSWKYSQPFSPFQTPVFYVYAWDI